MKINSIQQNQSNFKGGMLFGETKRIEQKAFSKIPTMQEWFVNSEHIVDMHPSTDPFAVSEGFQTFIETVRGMFAVKTPLDICVKKWSEADATIKGLITRVD